MIRSRHLAATGGLGALLLAIVFVTMFGSATIVGQLAFMDAEHLARNWLGSLQSEFDLPGVPAPQSHAVLDSFVGFLLEKPVDRADDIDVFDPKTFEAQQHFGTINGYAVFTRFGQLMIAGGTPFVRNTENVHMQEALEVAIAERQTQVIPVDFADTGGKPIVSVLIPLLRDDSVQGVVSIEIARHRFEIVMQKGVQFVATIAAAAMAAVALFGIVLLYVWGRAARQAQEQATFLAYTDPVTFLPNRRKFEEVLPQEIARAIASGVEIAVAFSDVDNFKAANDTYGHAAGDRMLVEIGNRLSALLKPGDQLFRVSGDHFAMIVQTPGGLPEAKIVCEQIQGAMNEPILPEEFGVKLSISTGMSRCMPDGRDAEGLMKAADLALYRAKADGRNTFRFYSREMSDTTLDTLRFQHALEQALAEDQLHLVYQPQVEAGSGRLLGFEALARWTHPVDGPVPPEVFIKVAEQAGLIKQVGAWALNKACETAAGWPDDLGVAVNLSPAQMRDSGLTRLVKKALEQSGLAPHRLELEVTEGVLMQDTDLTQQAFKSLRRLGVGLAMDDFGTGYSGLSYLTRIPLTKLKIDKQFVKRFGKGEKDDAIVKAVIRLGIDLGLEVTAEGVETKTQAKRLTAAGCTRLQGYLYGKPTADPQAVIDAAPLILTTPARMTG